MYVAAPSGHVVVDAVGVTALVVCVEDVRSSPKSELEKAKRIGLASESGANKVAVATSDEGRDEVLF
jgi:hypothetical protein